MSAVWMMVGAATPDGATFSVKVDGGGPVRVAVANNAGMSSPVFTSSQAVDAQGVAKVSITGLASSSNWWWRVEDNGVIDTSRTGRFRTLPTAGLPASFTIGIAGDAGLAPVYPGNAGGELAPTLLSNSPLFETLRQRGIDEDWVLTHLHGDWGYPDWSVGITDTLANRRTFWDDQLRQTNQAPFWQEGNKSWTYDDHDGGPNNWDGTYANKANNVTIFQERMPDYPLADPTAGVFRSRQIGRVLVVFADVRYNKSPSGDPDTSAKTMLGSAQKTWLASLLVGTDAKLVVWLMPGQWIGDPTAADTWISYQTEQAELVAMFQAAGIPLVILGADAHMIALDTGANSPGGFPTMLCASIDATPLGNPDLYSLGGQRGRDQYGTLTVTDLDSGIVVRMDAWQGTSRVLTHQFGFNVATAAPASSGALERTLAGSHRAIFEARVLTEFQTGDDPDGTEIDIIDGEVRYDATADSFATLRLITTGFDQTNGRSRFPRATDHLLTPYGDEIFVRRGVDLGGNGELWTPLGYFQIRTIQQEDPPYGPLTITARDRMAQIVDSRLIAPRFFRSTATFGEVLNDLVLELYPDLPIVWDDDTNLDLLNRELVAEESRHTAVRDDLAGARGKVAYFADTGELRIEDPPDTATPSWQVRSGRNGVLLSASRQITREGVFNGVRAQGSAADGQSVTATAVDLHPLSPTYWGPVDGPAGRFGRVVRYYASPLLHDPDAATRAAISILQRSLGLPYRIDWGAVANPTVRPRQAGYVWYRDNSRETHVLESCAIPLVAERHMTGATREQSLIHIGVLP